MSGYQSTDQFGSTEIKKRTNMKVEYDGMYGYAVVRDDDHYMHCDAFPTIQALENHIKLMLIAVQNYKEDNGTTSTNT